MLFKVYPPECDFLFCHRHLERLLEQTQPSRHHEFSQFAGVSSVPTFSHMVLLLSLSGAVGMSHDSHVFPCRWCCLSANWLPHKLLLFCSEDITDTNT